VCTDHATLAVPATAAISEAAILAEKRTGRHTRPADAAIRAKTVHSQKDRAARGRAGQSMSLLFV
jgi:hypothetical protein